MTVRKYGQPPFNVAVIHGGPGLPGYMAPLARELSRDAGVIEPFQSADSFEGQIDELVGQLEKHTTPPVTLVGSSWGAVLALFTAARRPELVEKLVLIGSAVFDREHSEQTAQTRYRRQSPENLERFQAIEKLLETATEQRQKALLTEMGELLFDVDAFDPTTRVLEIAEYQYDINRKVWPEFVEWRDRPGALAAEFAKITAPAVIIHGDYDPHPYSGVAPHLQQWLRRTEFYLLPDCGHYPWIERQARKQFFKIMRENLPAKAMA